MICVNCTKLSKCFKVLKAAGMENLRPDVLDHFQHKMIPTILALQARSDVSSTDDSIHQQSVAPVKSLDEFGDEILRCCEGLTLYQVNQES